MSEPRIALSSSRLRLAAGAVTVLLLWLAWWSIGQLPDGAHWLQSRQQQLLALRAEGPWRFAAGYFVLLTVLSALSLPGSSVLALAAGVLFGPVGGTLLVCTASTVGATLAFLAARHWWRDAVRRRWGARMSALEQGLARDATLYLFSLRVAPLVPYLLLNLMMGLTQMSTVRFFVVSMAGMLAGSAAYVMAGSGLLGAADAGWRGLLSWPVLAGTGLLALLPWLGRALWRKSWSG